MRPCSIVNHFIDVCSDTDDPSRNIRFTIIDQLNKTKGLSADDIDRLSPYIKDLKALMIGIESIVQNALRKDRTYDD